MKFFNFFPYIYIYIYIYILLFILCFSHSSVTIKLQGISVASFVRSPTSPLIKPGDKIMLLKGYSIPREFSWIENYNWYDLSCYHFLHHANESSLNAFLTNKFKSSLLPLKSNVSTVVHIVFLGTSANVNYITSKFLRSSIKRVKNPYQIWTSLYQSCWCLRTTYSLRYSRQFQIIAVDFRLLRVIPYSR